MKYRLASTRKQSRDRQDLPASAQQPSSVLTGLPPPHTFFPEVCCTHKTISCVFGCVRVCVTLNHSLHPTAYVVHTVSTN